MEIGPISGIRALPMLKARSRDPELTALSDIEQLTRIGDETYTPSDGESAGGAEEDQEDLLDPPESEELEQAAATPMVAGPGGKISFFA